LPRDSGHSAALGFATLRIFVDLHSLFRAMSAGTRRSIFYPLYGLAFFAALAVLSAKGSAAHPN